MWVWVCVMWRSEVRFWNLVLLYHVGPGTVAQAAEID